MPRVHRLPRRAFLRGVGGIAVALPALEIMMAPTSSRAGSSPIVPRFLTSYVGTSTGRRYWVDDTCCGVFEDGDRITPDIEGPGYDIKHALLPIGAAPWQYLTGYGGDQPAYDVRDEVTVVSGLRVPWGEVGAIPPGGRLVNFHGTTVTPQLSGTICEDRGRPPLGPTVDQLVAEQIGGDTPFASLAYRVEARAYNSDADSGNTGAMSWKRDVAGGVVRVDPVVHPGFAWETLFTGFVPPDPAEAARLAFELAQRRTVLDLVADQTETLVGRLGYDDRLRLEQHLEEIRSLERRLQELAPPSSPQCEQLPNPGQDWPDGTWGDELETETNKWSNEELRAEVFVDLVHMAFVCDLTRVVSLMFEHWKSYMNMYPATGHLKDIHDMTHFGGEGTGIGPMSDALAWHHKHFARLVRKLKDTQDPDGTPVLDRTILTMVFEGGWGYDPESAELGEPDISPHSTENMVVLVAGGRGLGLTPGRHVTGNGAHPAAVLLGAAQACGMTDALGDITEPFAGL